MKAEINLKNKEKFFGLYWGQLLARYPENVSALSWNVSDALESGIENRFLQLKPLSSISDEDSIFLTNLEGNCHQMDWDNTQFLNRGKNIAKWLIDELENRYSNSVFTTEKFIWVVDYLRSKGYALPWMGLSVKEMVEAGWIKLVS